MKKIDFFGDNPELNITPLVDVMLVLLVVLMLIVPALRYDELINLPNGSKQQSSKASNKSLIVSIKQGEIKLNNTSYTKESFFDNLSLKQNGFDRSQVVYIAADAEVKYELVMEVLAAFKKLGFSKISLQTR